MSKFIPYHIVCPLASCTRSNTCARYANYLKAKAEADFFEVLNLDHLKIADDSCPYHLVTEHQRWARGFARLCDSIPKGNSRYLNIYTPFTQRRFYKAKNGEFALNPEMQKELLSIFEQKGADTSLGFDNYEEKEVYLEK